MLKPRLQVHLLGAGVSILTALLMFATEPQMAIVWDEGYTLGREESLRDWFRALGDPPRFAATWQPRPPDDELVQRPLSNPPPRSEQVDSRGELLFDSDVLAWFWPFAREEPHGHPPFYALLGMIGDLIVPSWQELPRARLGPILLFSVTGGLIFSFLATRWGYWPAALAAGSWVLQPNLFGHGHYAAYDAVLSSLWVLSIVAFTCAVGSEPDQSKPRIHWLATLTFGVLVGCAAGTKLTGWFLPLPYLAWAILYRSRRGFVTLALTPIIAGVVLFLLLPPWWSEPAVGVLRFLDSNVNRARSILINIQFLGATYVTPKESLPWYNTLLWTVLVTPVGFLILAGLGVWTAVRRWRNEWIAVLFAAHWSFLMILRGLPHVPGHDGVRLFLPAFGVLALLGGAGARSLLDRSRRWAKVAITAALVEGAVSLAVMMPVPLSYFSPLVGGLPGAYKLGMEPTYYWDALNLEARRWLADNTSPGRTIEFRGFPLSWLYLRRIGELPRQLAPIDRGRPQWVVLQNRPGAFSEADRALIANGRPAYMVEKLGVPLVWVFPYSDSERPITRHAPERSASPQRERQEFASHPQGLLRHGDWSRVTLREADDRAKLVGKSWGG
jgi:4-amino-4-deoxy-L-arabinose transferase-like glycosyltransferase